MTTRRRVVVTGMGMISPVGLSVEESWQSAVNGRTGVGPLTLFDTSGFSVHLSAEVKGFNPENYMHPKDARRRDRYQWFAAAAAKEALDASGFKVDPEKAFRVGVSISSSIGGVMTLLEEADTLREKGPRRLSPFGVPRIMANGAAGLLSIDIGARGPAFATISACASGGDAIGMAMLLIRSGIVDAMIAGSADAPITPLGVGGLGLVGVASRQSGQPIRTPAPFSAHRDGLVVGEGAGILIIEALEHAQARGAPILAELAGYGSTADAFHITAPSEDGSGAAMAMQLALEDAGISPEDVDYINAHGTATLLNDVAETIAIKRVLGEYAYKIPISSTKSVTGHLMGTTGAVEAVFSVLAIRDNIAPPTINYLEKDPECDLDYVPNQARELPINVVVSNSFGFGGHNAVLVLKRFE